MSVFDRSKINFIPALSSAVKLFLAFVISLHSKLALWKSFIALTAEARASVALAYSSAFAIEVIDSSEKRRVIRAAVRFNIWGLSIKYPYEDRPACFAAFFKAESSIDFVSFPVKVFC